MQMTKRSIETRGRIFGVIRKTPWSTVHDIRRETGISKTTIRKHVNAMLEGDVIKGRKRALRRNVSAMAYAESGHQDLPEYSILIDGQETYYPLSVKLKVILNAEGTDYTPGEYLRYSRDLAGLPITEWKAIVLTKWDLEPLNDKVPKRLSYYDPDLGAWFDGQVTASESARYEWEGAVYVIYRLEGHGPLRVEWSNQ